jgi:hypothetical protein
MAGSDVQVLLTLDEPGTATLDGFSLVGTRWAQSPDPPAGGLVRLGFLFHIEQDINLVVDEATWRRRATVVDALSAALSAHGAALSLQADATFIRGAATWDPGWIEAREAEGMAFSVHVHDESGGETDVEQGLRDGRSALRESNVMPTDLNGGFLTAPWLTARLAGFTSLTAFKDPTTQLGLPRVQIQPWRPADGVGGSDPAAFMVHDPDGPLLYLPGHDIREVDHARFPGSAAQVMSQVLAHARPNYVNTWYFVLHVDGFGPIGDDAALDAYLAGDTFQADIAAYDQFLTDTADPLVDQGFLVYDTPAGMEATWEAWLAKCAEE